MFDEYDYEHSTKYKTVINFYCMDLEWNINSGYVIDEKNAIDTIKDSVSINDNDFFNRVLKTIYKLKNCLDVLDNRTITNIGGRVMFNGDFYLVQVWRGSSN
jgi:hypothetical protein